MQRIVTTTALPETNTVAQRLHIKSDTTASTRVMGDFRTGKISWDANRALLHLRNARFNVTLAFSHRAHWQGVRGSGIEWISGENGQKTGSGAWALDFDGLKAGDDIIVVAR